MRHHRTTGLTNDKFDHLIERLAEQITWDQTTGRPRALTLRQAVKATLMYLKNNITQEVIAELLFVDQAVISRAISDLEGPIADVLDEFIPDPATELDGRVAVVDGTLCPCWSWADAPELWSGKHKTTGHSHQLACTLDGDLVYVSDPLPGRTHDARAFSQTGLATFLDPTNTIADKGYIGVGPTTPFRKPAGHPLTEWQHDFNRQINQLRYVIERAIANFKTWRILFTDYRRPRHTYNKAFRAVRALHFYKLASA